MPNYNNGIIYKICCRDPTIKDEYVGSTTNLRQRRSHHRYFVNNPDKSSMQDNLYSFIREHGGWDNWQLVQLEEYACETKTQLLMKEREWFEKCNSTLNACKPGNHVRHPDKNSYQRAIRQENPERYNEQRRGNYKPEQKRDYYQRNREEILRKAKIRYDLQQAKVRDMKRRLKELEELDKKQEAELAELNAE